MIIAVANQKGGVGKTTTAVTLAHGLANRGYKTLLIDLDPQGHVVVSLGGEKSPALYDWLVNQKSLYSVTVPARTRLDVIPNDKSGEKVKREIAASYFPAQVIKRALEKAPYEVVIIDTAPSMDILQVAAIVACNRLLVPTKLDGLAIDGVNEILRTYAEIAMQGHAHAEGYHVLPTFFDRVTNETHAMMLSLADTFKDHLWPPIPIDTKCREAATRGKTIWEYAPKGKAAQGMRSNNHSSNIGGYTYVLDLLESML